MSRFPKIQSQISQNLVSATPIACNQSTVFYFHVSIFTVHYLQITIFEHQYLRRTVFEHRYLRRTVFEHRYLRRTVFEQRYLRRTVFEHRYLRRTVFEHRYLQRTVFEHRYPRRTMVDHTVLRHAEICFCEVEFCHALYSIIMNILKIPPRAMDLFMAAVGILRIFMIVVRFYFPACTLNWVQAEQERLWECARPFPQSSKNGKGSATPDYTGSTVSTHKSSSFLCRSSYQSQLSPWYLSR